jgi:DNA-binding LytR/AlgR family response regulator
MKQPKIIRTLPKGKTIILLESDNNYTIIHLSDGKRILSGYNLKFYEHCTDHQTFIRPNRSVMINRMFVANINFKEFALTLNDGRKIVISRRRIKGLQTSI